jgi:LMBR1 domain-containing protein 1
MAITTVPDNVLAAGWIPFVVVLVLVFIFSFIYIRCYQSHTDKELCSTLTAIAGLVVALLTCALVPVDIFLASFMKTGDGRFKEWAVDEKSRNSIENSVMIAYYVLYGCMMLFIFAILPFAYFYYEEGDDETTPKTRCCISLKYSAVFLLIAAVLFIIGAFVPFHGHPSSNNSTNVTVWEEILSEIGNDRGETALSFMISALAVVGVFLLVVYTASGMSSWPFELFKGHNVSSNEYQEVDQQSPTGTHASRRMQRPWSRPNGQHVQHHRHRHRCWRRCMFLLRPFDILLGVVLSLLALLVILTLLLSNIDKLLHSSGAHMGYIMTESKLPNPVDISLVFLQKVFPLDYILMSALVMFLFFCSMTGIRNLGVWFCWIRMYRIRVQHTKPQALLFLCFLLMLIVLALNILVYQLAPQYMTYGSQLYATNSTSVNTTMTAVETTTVQTCNVQAPRSECVSTRVSVMLYRIFYKFWFFGAIYYWAMWAFLLVFAMALILAVIRKRSNVDSNLDESEFSSEDE